MRWTVCLISGILLWANLVGPIGADQSDCPRIVRGVKERADRLCENTIANGNTVPLFHAMARLWLERELPAANRMLHQAYRDLLDGASDMTPELADENAKWQMRLWVRTYALFNSHCGWFPGRLDLETERLTRELLWKYAVPELTNLADFSEDDTVRRKMTMLLDILWADWAVEQLGGIRGGGKSRVYQGKYSRFGDRDSYLQMANVLWGEGAWTNGRQSHTNSGFVHCLATTRYRLPEIVVKLTDPDRRGSYVSISRRPAKMTGIFKLPDHLPHSCWYVLDPDDTRAVRYTYCTPDYILGSWWVDPLW